MAAQNYVLLERIELNASVASVTFGNIPQSGYTDLKIVCSARSERATAQDTFKITFNATGSGYSFKRIYGDGTTAASDGSTGDATLTGGYSNGNSSTANTFGNTEFYIPNYTSSNYKSVSVDGVGETNATTTYAGMFASLWSNTAAITSVKIEGGTSANFMAYSTFSLYGLAAVGTTPAIPKATGGDTVISDGTYWYHAFLSSGTFKVNQALSCNILVVAGGGGGGSGYYTGGGGAGGLLSFTSQTVTSDSTVTVGAGGASATIGGNSQFASLTAAVGGGRGGPQETAGGNGGSGGGGGGNASNSYYLPGGTATSGQGNNGGSGFNRFESIGAGGGGGGNGAAGSNATSATGGAGGSGTSSFSSYGAVTGTGQNISGTYWYAGGGGGGGANSGGAGGSGGGAAGIGGFSQVDGIAALVNTGGGGGGANMGDPVRPGGTGGSGIVIIRYAV